MDLAKWFWENDWDDGLSKARYIMENDHNPPNFMKNYTIHFLPNYITFDLEYGDYFKYEWGKYLFRFI